MGTHSSILAWTIPWTCSVCGVAKNQTRLSDFHFRFLDYKMLQVQIHHIFSLLYFRDSSSWNQSVSQGALFLDIQK